MSPRYLLLLAASVACSAAAQPGAAPVPAAIVQADTASLRRVLDSIADAHQGIVGYTVIDLETGARVERRGNETFPTASLIKVPILVTVFDLVASGRMSLDDPLTVLKIDQVPGSGVIQYLHNGTVLTVNDAAWLMTTISDNTATNLLLDRIIIRRAAEPRGGVRDDQGEQGPALGAGHRTAAHHGEHGTRDHRRVRRSSASAPFVLTPPVAATTRTG